RRVGGDSALRVAEEVQDFKPEKGQDREGQPERPMDEAASQAEQQAETDIHQAEKNNFRQTRPRQSEVGPPAAAVVLLAEPVAADVAVKLQVARVDDVMRAVGAVALAFLGHAADVAGLKTAQEAAAEAAPGQFQVHAEAATGLHAGEGGGCQGSRG